MLLQGNLHRLAWSPPTTQNRNYPLFSLVVQNHPSHLSVCSQGMPHLTIYILFPAQWKSMHSGISVRHVTLGEIWANCSDIQLLRHPLNKAVLGNRPCCPCQDPPMSKPLNLVWTQYCPACVQTWTECLRSWAGKPLLSFWRRIHQSSALAVLSHEWCFQETRVKVPGIMTLLFSSTYKHPPPIREILSRGRITVQSQTKKLIRAFLPAESAVNLLWPSFCTFPIVYLPGQCRLNWLQIGVKLHK